MDLDLTDSRLQDELDWRFSQREEADDVFWGMFEFNQKHLPEEVQFQDIPRYLAQTGGDTHPTRMRVLANLRVSNPQLAAGLY